MRKKKVKPTFSNEIAKAPTGIKGFDEITFGGIPRGRPTLICGNTGCGKTLMALEILIRGAVEFNEPGVFFAFEETEDDLIKNVASMGFDLHELINKKLIFIDYVYVDTVQSIEGGEYDLEGLFIRFAHAVDTVKAKRIAMDTLEVLFSGFYNEGVLRSELRRLFLWIKERKLTAVVTGEQGSKGTLTRHGIEEYVADCVILLSHRLCEELITRRLQIIKYRGSYHETNEFPFLITRKGISVLPITSLELTSLALSKRISTGIPALDSIMGGKGYFEGSSILISGSSGCGKTSFAGAFANQICHNNQRCLFFSYEESEEEILRNLASIGLNLKKKVNEGYLKIIATRPTQWGLEKHIGTFMEAVEDFKPDAVIVDPISTLSHCGSETQVYSALTRMIDFLKKLNITFLMTILYLKEKGQEFSYGISSIIDTWILLRNDESNGELNRELIIIKSRGMSHSNQVREFSLSARGISIKEPYYGESGVLTGTARLIQEHKDLIEEADNLNKLGKLHDKVELKKNLMEIHMQALNAEIEYQEKIAKTEERLMNLKESVHKESRDDLKNVRLMNNEKAKVKRKHVKNRKK